MSLNLVDGHDLRNHTGTWCDRLVLGQAQMEARWARRREAEAERNARLLLEQEVAAERMRATEEAARRKAMDRFLSEIHTEERAYLRQREVGARPR